MAAEQTSFITHDGLDANSVTISRTVHSLLITKCEGKALSLVSLIPPRFGLEVWRGLKEEYEGVRGILNPRARKEKMYSEGRDLGDMLASWRKTLHGTELPQVQTSSRRSKWRTYQQPTLIS